MTRAWLSGASALSGVRLLSVLSSSWAVASALLSGEHLAMSPAPTSVTDAVAACAAAPCTAISTAVVHDSSTTKIIEASSRVVFLIPLPFHKDGARQHRRVVQRNHASTPR